MVYNIYQPILKDWLHIFSRPRVSFIISKTFIATEWKLIYFNSAENTAYSQIEPIYITLPVFLTSLIIWFSDPQQIKSTKLANAHLMHKKRHWGMGEKLSKQTSVVISCMKIAHISKSDSIVPPPPLPGCICLCLIQGKENNQTYLSSPKVHCFTGIDVPVDVSPLAIRSVLFILYKKPKNYFKLSQKYFHDF